MSNDDEPTIEQEEDAALDQILGDDLDTQEMVEPKDNPSPSEEDKEAVEDAGGDEEYEYEYEYEDEESSEQDSDEPVTTATALKRDNVPSEFIDALKEKFGDEAVDAWAAKAASRQKSVDAFSSEMRELKQQISDLQKDGANSTDSRQPGGNTDDAANPDDSQQDDLGQVAEIYGDELADPIRATREQLNKLTEELSSVRRESELRESVAFALGDIALERGGLTSEQRAEINQMANKMGEEAPGTFASVADLMSQAAEKVLGPVKTTAKSKRTRRTQMTPPSQTPIPEKALTREDEEDLALDRILGDWNP